MRIHARATIGAVLALGTAAAVTAALPAQRSPGLTKAATAAAQGTQAQGIQKIKHVIIIMQENRSFDNYFGAFPGADGIPMKNGKPTVCVPDPLTGQCVAPFVDHKDQNPAGPHRASNSTADVDGGKMDGFIGQAEVGRCGSGHKCAADQVMGYHVQSDIPNYWAYAKNFVLNEHMY